MGEDVDQLLAEARRLRFDQPDSARRRAEDAVAAGRNADDRDGLGRALAMLGRLARDAGDRAAALRHYEEAAALARRAGDPTVLAHRLRHVGDVHLEMGEALRAGALVDEALALSAAAGLAPLDRANLLRSAALQREASGRAAEAATFWRDAGDLYAQSGIEAGVAECRRHLGAAG